MPRPGGRRRGDIPEAIHHALAACEPERAAALIAAHWNRYLQRGQLATARGWLDALDPEFTRRRGDLLLARAWLELDSGRPQAAGRAADAAEASGSDPPEAALPVAAGVPMLRAVLGYMSGDLGKATAAARRALEVTDPESPWIAVAWAMLGAGLLWQPASGDEADAALSRAIDRAAPGENMIAVLHAHAARGLLRFQAGERQAAARALDHAREVRDAEGLGEYSWASLASGLEGRLLEDRGELDRAAADYERAVLLAVRGRVAPERAYALIRLAGVRAVLGEGDAARSALAEARRVLAACPQPGVLAHALAAALYVSVNTPKTHVRSIYRKLGARSREEALIRGRERGLL